MAYSSTVSAPILVRGTPGGAAQSTAMPGYGHQEWSYTSTADALATVVGSSYFSDGYLRGMRKWDKLRFLDVASTLEHLLTVTAVTTTGGATVSSLLTT